MLLSGRLHTPRRRPLRTLLVVGVATLTTLLPGTAVLASTVGGPAASPVASPVASTVGGTVHPRLARTGVVTPPSCPTVNVKRGGGQAHALYRNNQGGTWDVRSAVWSDLTYPVRSESWGHGCIRGGVVRGPVPREATRDQWYDGIGGHQVSGEGLRITMTGAARSWVAVKDMVISDIEDAYDPNAGGTAARTYLDHVRAEHIRDDCIENEDPVHNVYLDNSLFDGCFTAFAERPPGSQSAQNGTARADFVVRNSLIHVEPQPLGPAYCGPDGVARGRCRPHGDTWLGSYGIWKWSDHAAAHVEVRHTIFRLDMASYTSCRSQQWPRGTYVDVTLVWTGAGPYRTAGDCTNTLPPGVTLTEDTSVWDRAVDAWQHQ